MPKGCHKSWKERTQAVCFIRRLGQVFHRHRLALGSQYAIRSCGQQTVSRLEHGIRASRFDSLARAAHECGVCPGTLFVEASTTHRRLIPKQRKLVDELCQILNEGATSWNGAAFQTSLGETLREIRVGKHEDSPRMFLRELAREAEVDHTFLSRVERGSSKISIPILFDVCQALDTSIARIVVTALCRDSSPRHRLARRVLGRMTCV